MENNHLNASFVRQFHQEYTTYPGSEDQKYENFYFRQFAGNKNEISAIDELMTEKMNHSKFAGQLIKKLENEDERDCQKLAAFVHKLLQTFSSYAHDEPYAAWYFNRLATTLKPFLLSLNTFHKNLQQNVLRLKILFPDKVNAEKSSYICSEDVDNAQWVFEEYLDELRAYYDDFAVLLQQESNKPSRVNVTSVAEQSLFKLVMLIQESIVNVEATCTSLQELNAHMTAIELQELYN